MLISKVKQYFDSRNMKMVETLWLIYAHILGIIGAIWFCCLESGMFYRYLFAFYVWHALSGLGVTAGVHRLWAHRSYTGSLGLRIYLMLMNSNCFQGSIWHWSRDHRLHHKFSDTPLDPHNVTNGFWYSHVGWLLVKKSPELVKEGKLLDLSDLKADPVVMFQKRYYLFLATLMAFVLPTISGLLISSNVVFNFLFLGFTKYIWLLNITWCVNSVCHLYGTRKWNPRIEPRDNIFVSFLSLGEGWHNWHHEYPKDWVASKNDWWMVNATYSFLKICDSIGLADVNQIKRSQKSPY